MKVTDALRLAAQLTEAAAKAIEDGKSELPADTFSAPAHQALSDLDAAIKFTGG